jgi:hypothetical protein
MNAISKKCRMWTDAKKPFERILIAGMWLLFIPLLPIVALMYLIAWIWPVPKDAPIKDDEQVGIRCPKCGNQGMIPRFTAGLFMAGDSIVYCPKCGERMTI